jgi:hypothetical protein
MLSAKERSRRAYRGRKFVPSSPDGLPGARLEARALTAPAIWRRPLADPLSANDRCRAVWGTGSGSGVMSAGGAGWTTTHFENWQSWDPMAPPVLISVTDVKLTSMAGAEAVDLPNTEAPDEPIGNTAVSFNTFTSMQAEVTGPDWFVQNSLDAQAQVVREYLLAEDFLGPSGPATLQETFSVDFIQPTNNGNGLWVNVELVGYINSGNWNVTYNSLQGGGNTISTVAINGNALIAPPPGTVSTGTINLPGGQAFAYAWSATDLVVTVTTPVGNLPLAVRNPNGTVTGNAWRVDMGNSILVAAESRGGGNSFTNVGAQYDAYFI